MSEERGRVHLPALRIDEEAERFVDEADLTDDDLSGFDKAPSDRENGGRAIK